MAESPEYLASKPPTPQAVSPLPLLCSSVRSQNASGVNGSHIVTVFPHTAINSSKPSSLGKCFSMDSLSEDVDDLSSTTKCVHLAIPSVSLTRKIAAEFIGTFVLIFVATASAIVDEKTGGSITIVGKSIAAGLAVMIIILAVGHVSGAHLNPSLTIAFAAMRKFSWPQVPFYVAAQVAGSICASFALKGVFHPELHGGVTTPSGSVSQSFIIEFIITFILMFVVTAVATDTRAVGELAGIAVGATVTMNVLIAGSTSGASMNPVRTLGPAIAANNYKGLWLYMIGPSMGALAGAAAYSLIRLPEEDPNPIRSIRSFP